MELEQLYKEVKDMDVNEPACMIKIHQHLAELQDEAEKFMELLLQKVGDEPITWNRPWYQSTRCLTRPLAVPDKDVSKFRTGSMLKEEVDRIEKNWNRFRKVYDVPNKIICLARYRNKTTNNHTAPEEKVKRFVTAYLARGLKRNLYQVYRHIIAHYGGSVRGDYSEIEEKLVEICVTHIPKNVTPILSMLLRREPRHIYRKLNNLKNGKLPPRRMKWTLPVAERFLKYLMRYTNLPLNELEDKEIDLPVWKKLENKFDHNYRHLKIFWYKTLHVQLFVKQYVSLRGLQKILYKKLSASHCQIWSDIRWKEIAKDFPTGFTPSFLNKIAYRGICSHPNYMKTPLSVLTQYGIKKIKERKKRGIKPMCLKNLKLNQNGKLELIKFPRG